MGMKITASDALALYNDERFVGSLKKAFLADKKARDKLAKRVAKELASAIEEEPALRTRILQEVLAHEVVLEGAKNMVGRREPPEAEDQTLAGDWQPKERQAGRDKAGHRGKKTAKKVAAKKTGAKKTGGKKARTKKKRGGARAHS